MNLRGLGAFRDRKRGTRSDLSRRPAPDKRSAPAEAEQEPVDEAEQIRFDATRRAELERAQSIRCYVSPGIGGTFTVVGAAMNPQVAVDPALLWQAQMTLWVQREVCMALAEVNENAAKALTEAGQENVDVTTLPIKRLIRLAVGTYRVIDRMADAPKGKGKKGSKKKASKSRSAPKRSKGLGGGGLGAALAARGVGRQAPDKDKDKAAEKGSASFQADLVGETWTGRQSGEDLDVVPVAIQLVMDQRYLPQVIDRVCHANFYVPTRVSYRALRASEIPREYVYGANPVVGVTLTFERYFFPEVYADKMPVIVHDILGHVLADESADEGRRGGRSTGRRPRRR